MVMVCHTVFTSVAFKIQVDFEMWTVGSEDVDGKT